MKRKLFAQPDGKSIAAYVKKNASKVRKILRHHHKISATMREAEYKGHHIVVRTTYEIRVDGTPVTGHTAVTNDGQVHYHPIPNISFASAIDLVKQLIDVYPDDFAGGEHDGHPRRAKRRSRSRSARRRTKIRSRA